jgi:sec-independent protein translocase protein TatA
MAGIGVPELAIVLVIIVIIFGVGKLPEIGGALGKGIREFKTESTPELEALKKDGLDAGKTNGTSVLNTASDKARESEPVKVASSRADEI